jgi:exo-beta-1,3-glucanase (GH17 family)
LHLVALLTPTVFLDEYVCQANANGTEYFYFEPFDEPWKKLQFGGVEGRW